MAAERRSGDMFQAEVQANRPAFALFRMTWHQNWKASVDGQPAATFMLSPGFIGVPVAPGTHRVELRYQPDGWRLMLACAGLMAGLFLIAAEQTGVVRFAQTDIQAPVEPEPEPAGEPKRAGAAHPRRKRRQRK